MRLMYTKHNDKKHENMVFIVFIFYTGQGRIFNKIEIIGYVKEISAHYLFQKRNSIFVSKILRTN